MKLVLVLACTSNALGRLAKPELSGGCAQATKQTGASVASDCCSLACQANDSLSGAECGTALVHTGPHGYLVVSCTTKTKTQAVSKFCCILRATRKSRGLGQQKESSRSGSGLGILFATCSGRIDGASKFACVGGFAFKVAQAAETAAVVQQTRSCCWASTLARVGLAIASHWASVFSSCAAVLCLRLLVYNRARPCLHACSRTRIVCRMHFG